MGGWCTVFALIVTFLTFTSQQGVSVLGQPSLIKDSLNGTVDTYVGSETLAKALELEGGLSFYDLNPASTERYRLSLYFDQNTEVLQFTQVKTAESFSVYVDEVVFLDDVNFTLTVRNSDGAKMSGTCTKIESPLAAPEGLWAGGWTLNIDFGGHRTLDAWWVRSLEFPVSWYVSSLGQVAEYRVWDTPEAAGVMTFSQKCCIVPLSRSSLSVYHFNYTTLRCEEEVGNVTNYFWDGSNWYDNSKYISDKLSPLVSCFASAEDVKEEDFVAPRVWGRLLPFSPGSTFMHATTGSTITYRVTDLDNQWWDNVTYGEADTRIISISSVADTYYVQSRVGIVEYQLADNGSVLTLGEENYIRLLPLVQGSYKLLPTSSFDADLAMDVTFNYDVDFDITKPQPVSQLGNFSTDKDSFRFNITNVDHQWMNGTSNGQNVSVHYVKEYQKQSSIGLADGDGLLAAEGFIPLMDQGWVLFERVLPLPMGPLYVDLVTGNKMLYWFDQGALLQVLTVLAQDTKQTQEYAVQSFEGANTVVRGTVSDVIAGAAMDRFNYTKLDSVQWVETDLLTGLNTTWTQLLSFGMGNFSEVDGTATFEYVLGSSGAGNITITQDDTEVVYAVEDMRVWPVSPTEVSVKMSKEGSFTLRSSEGDVVRVQYNVTVQAGLDSDELGIQNVTWTFDNGTSRDWTLTEELIAEVDLVTVYADSDTGSVPSDDQQAKYLDAATTLRLPMSAYLNSALTPEDAVGTTRKLIVCATNNPPLCTCDGKSGAETVAGMVPSIWEAAASTLGLAVTRDYVYKCVPDFDLMLDALSASVRDDDKVGDKPMSKVPYCHVAVGGLEYVTEGLQLGIGYSVPVYNSGFRLLTMSQAQTTDFFGFLRPFTLELWLLICATPLVVGAIIFFVERCAIRGLPEEEVHTKHEFLRNQWLTASMFLGVDVDPRSYGTFVIVLGLGFLVVVVVAAFTANTAAFLTQKSLVTSITDVKHIRDKVVATPFQYIFNDIFKYGPKKIVRSNYSDVDMVNALQSGEYDALIVTAPYAANVVKQQCNISAVGDLWLQRPISIAFNRMWSSIGNPQSASLKLNYVQAAGMVTSAIVELQQNKQLLTEAADKLNTEVEDVCSDSNKGSDMDQIGVKEMAGLWLILAGCVLIGLIITFLHSVYKKRMLRRKNLGKVPDSSKRGVGKNGEGKFPRWRQARGRWLQTLRLRNFSNTTPADLGQPAPKEEEAPEGSSQVSSWPVTSAKSASMDTNGTGGHNDTASRVI